MTITIITTICTITSVVISAIVMVRTSEANTRKLLERVTRVEDKADYIERELEECRTSRVPKVTCMQTFAEK